MIKMINLGVKINRKEDLLKVIGHFHSKLNLWIKYTMGTNIWNIKNNNPQNQHIMFV